MIKEELDEWVQTKLDEVENKKNWFYDETNNLEPVDPETYAELLDDFQTALLKIRRLM